MHVEQLGRFILASIRHDRFWAGSREASLKAYCLPTAVCEVLGVAAQRSVWVPTEPEPLRPRQASGQVFKFGTTSFGTDGAQ